DADPWKLREEGSRTRCELGIDERELGRDRPEEVGQPDHVVRRRRTSGGWIWAAKRRDDCHKTWVTSRLYAGLLRDRTRGWVHLTLERGTPGSPAPML